MLCALSDAEVGSVCSGNTSSINTIVVRFMVRCRYNRDCELVVAMHPTRTKEKRTLKLFIVRWTSDSHPYEAQYNLASIQNVQLCLDYKELALVLLQASIL